ncbi:MAG TPA: uroporphyrinogen-III synthase [Gaiellaceae bacterium]|nr:uroporphyrinogen-III synthase [Gaiellaceae bacterium]
MTEPVRVVLTRAGGGNHELADRLRASGLDVVECPLIRIEPLEGPPVSASGYDWLVLTSRVGAELFFARLAGPLPSVAVVGPGTAEAVRERGVEPAVVASRSTQEGLLEALPRPAGRVLFAGAEDARPILATELDADVLHLYRTVPDEVVEFPRGDLVVLASASAARALAALEIAVPCVTIGPVTSAEARAAALDVLEEAETHDVDGLTAAVKLAASRIASSRS